MKKSFVLILSAGLLVISFSAQAGSSEHPTLRKPSVKESSLALGAVAGMLSGNTLYHISYYEGPTGIESELEFPLNTMMGGISAEYTSANYRNQREWKVRATLMKNFGSVSGVLKDSDWLTDDLDIQEVGQAHPGKDIYSESDVDLDATTFDVSAIFNTIQENHLNIGPMVRFLYQNFHFIASNTNQVGYGPYNTPAYTGFISGKTLDYEVTYRILAFGISCEYPAYRKFRVNAQIAYAPWVMAEDIDDHVLRYKLSTGSTTGTAFLALFGLNWDLKPDVTLTLGGEYRKIRTTGTQQQYFYAGPNAGLSFSVSDRIDSTQTFLSAMLTFYFPQ